MLQRLNSYIKVTWMITTLFKPIFASFLNLKTSSDGQIDPMRYVSCEKMFLIDSYNILCVSKK